MRGRRKSGDEGGQEEYLINASLFCSSTNEVRGDICAFNVLALIDDVSAATEPERLAHISLGQENPRMRMNAAPG